MKFVFSGYSNYISMIEFDKDFNEVSRCDKQINSSSFITSGEWIYCYDREENPYIYMLSKEDLSIVDKIKVNTNNITHLMYSDKYSILYGCSYIGGSFFAVKVKDSKFLKVLYTIKEDELFESKCHMVLLNKRQDVLIVVNIARDRLNYYDVSNDNIKYIKSVFLPEKCGPRHATYSDDEKLIYVITEYSNEVIAIDENGNIKNKKSTLISNGLSFGGTIILRSPYLYVSNRGEETIGVFDERSLCHLESFSVYGKHSRHMIITDDGKYLVTCNKNSNEICFIDLKTKELRHKIFFENPSCVIELDGGKDENY